LQIPKILFDISEWQSRKYTRQEGEGPENKELKNKCEASLIKILF
jgi:hypothetical protein